MSGQSLAAAIESLGELEAHRKNLEQQVKAVKSQIETAKNALINALDDEGLDEAKVNGAKITLSESTYPKVESWDLFGEHICATRSIFLLERRPAVLAYRELLQLGRPVPGVLPFTERKLTYKDS